MPEILRGSEPRFEDMVCYMESASEGLAHHFAVEDDELRLKTNIRGGPLSAQCGITPTMLRARGRGLFLGIVVDDRVNALTGHRRQKQMVIAT